MARPPSMKAAPVPLPRPVIIFLNLDTILNVQRTIHCGEGQPRVGVVDANPDANIRAAVAALRELRDTLDATIVITEKSHARSPADTLLENGMVPRLHAAQMQPSTAADRGEAIKAWLRVNGPARSIVIDRPGVDAGEIRVSVSPTAELTHAAVARVVATVGGERARSND